MALPLIVLVAVLVLIAVRRVGRLRLAIWQIMCAGAIVVLLGGAIAPADALGAIDWDVMLFLFGVFVVGQGLADSGCLQVLSARLLCRFGSADGLVLAVILGSGTASALLMNDTLAVVAAPLMVSLAREHRLPPALLLLALAFGVTTGSVASPIGNPQNLLIALHGGLDNPFLVFGRGLALPTLAALALCYGVLRVAYRRHFHAEPLRHCPVTPGDPQLARLARAALWLLVGGVAVKIGVALAWPGIDLGLTWIALVAAAPLLLFGRARWRTLRAIDWHTLAFFAALFVLMASVWETGVAQQWLAHAGPLQALPTVFAAGIGLSQLVSNVPLVTLYLPLLDGAPAQAMLALAAASTIAGNLLVLGAASNVIIIQRAERHGATLGFVEFARVGVPLTAAQAAVYWWFLA